MPLALQKDGLNGFRVVLRQSLSRCLLMGVTLRFLGPQGGFVRETLSPLICLFFWQKV